ncbi:hypothetical protein SUGI_0125370 [Cryptomeria japonica]|nr:hypothetical protein SUGI_0125370 [Cryptomeria japonica]
MARRGRGRGGLSQMYRDMQNLQRKVADLMNMMENQRPRQRGGNSDEGLDQGDTNQSEEPKEEIVNRENFEERILRALEGKNE